MIEYGIARNLSNLEKEPVIICSGLTKEAAEDWMQSHLSSQGSQTEFCIISRQVGDWDLAEDTSF